MQKQTQVVVAYTFNSSARELYSLNPSTKGDIKEKERLSVKYVVAKPW